MHSALFLFSLGSPALSALPLGRQVRQNTQIFPLDATTPSLASFWTADFGVLPRNNGDGTVAYA
jgi:hypothetical protein